MADTATAVRVFDDEARAVGFLDRPGRREATVGHQVQSSCSSRHTAGASGFLILSQCTERPARYGEPNRLDTMSIP
jgi:hypothetical protein